MTPPDLARQILARAIEQCGGEHREGQAAMVDAIRDSFASGTHLMVQAGTGTGKSLAYLAASFAELAEEKASRVVVATATLALQAQLAHADIPLALKAVEEVTGRRPVTAILKGRTNYACLLRVRGGGDALDQDSLIGEDAVAETSSQLGAEVLRLREWAEQQVQEHGLADRDDAPSHSPRAWAQVSIPTRECVGVANCPFGSVCRVEESRDRARRADLVVTNHALVAIDAMHGGTALPEHDRLVIDEAHELVSRVTGAASAELTAAGVERVSRRVAAWADDDVVADLHDAGVGLAGALQDLPLEQLQPGSPAVPALARVRDAAREAVSQLSQGETSPERQQAAQAAQEVFDIADRMAALDDHDVCWVADGDRIGRHLVVGPLSVAPLVHSRILGGTSTVLTSATLRIGGDFASVASTIGLWARDRRSGPVGEEPDRAESGAVTSGAASGDEDSAQPWWALDVGSPFDYGRQGILFVADSLPPPRRDGIGAEALETLAELIWAADGHTLGLFASQRNAEIAAQHVRRAVPGSTVLCQGDAQLFELTRRFVAEPGTSLFGTLSLWQGVDVPGDTCRLVVIDKIPFPRPDDPMMQARQRAVARAGGNGFMAVAATQAGLLLAQGAGRLIRRSDDRGVVAVLDPRLATARYGSFLRASMPPLWTTNNQEVAVQALRRLAAAAA